MALCKPRRDQLQEPGKNGKDDHLQSTKPARKDRATLSEEYARERGKFDWTMVNFIMVVVLFVPVLVFLMPKYRVGAPINNSAIQYAGMPYEIEVAIRVVLAFFITAFVVVWVSRLGTKALTIRTLWLLYFCIGAFFHLASWERFPLPNGEYAVGSFRSPAFTALALMHVMAEAMLSLSTVIPRSQADWWQTRTIVYLYLAGFLMLACQQKTFSLYGILAGVALVADTFTLVAGIAIWQRASDGSVKLFAAMWALNTPVIGWILLMLTWRSQSEDNWTGLGVLALMVQYILLASVVGKHVVLRDLPDDELEKELREKGILAPDPETDAAWEEDAETGGLMNGASKPKKSMSPKTAFVLTAVLCSILFAAALVAPIITGHLDLKRFIE